MRTKRKNHIEMMVDDVKISLDNILVGFGPFDSRTFSAKVFVKERGDSAMIVGEIYRDGRFYFVKLHDYSYNLVESVLKGHGLSVEDALCRMAVKNIEDRLTKVQIEEI